MQQGWYYRVSGRECGPVSYERLAELLRHRRLLPADEILKGPTGSWIKARDCRELTPLFAGQAGTWDADTTVDEVESSSAILNAPVVGKFPTTEPEVATAARTRHLERAWYCLIRQEECGPFHASDLQRMLADGALIPLDLVRRGTSGTWKEYFQWERQIAADAAVEIVEQAKTVETQETPSAEKGDRTLLPPPVSGAIVSALDFPRTGRRHVAPRTSQGSISRATRLRELTREHWPLVAAGAVLLSANLFALIPVTDANQERYAIFNQLLDHARTLRDHHASPDEWKQIDRDMEQTIQPMIVALNKNSDVHHPIEQHLLWAGRDYLLPLIEDYKRESLDPQRAPRPATGESAVREQRFQQHMQEAARLFEYER